MKQPTVYIMANKINGTIYTGVTTNLVKRVYEHKYALTPGFTSRYNCKILVFFETCDSVESAILREKQLKAGTRREKLKLINKNNPEWDDLYEKII